MPLVLINIFKICKHITDIHDKYFASIYILKNLIVQIKIRYEKKDKENTP